MLAVGGYWKFAVAPKREQAAALDQKVIAAEAQLAQTQSLIATYKDAKAQYKANYATVVRLGKAVPADDDTRSLVVQLDTAAKRSGIDFDSINLAAGGGACRRLRRRRRRSHRAPSTSAASPRCRSTSPSPASSTTLGELHRRGSSVS